jgi:tetratricopeptide (TPR) repeat protein
MTRPSDPVKPIPFSVAEPTPGEAVAPATASGQSRWLVPALLLLVLLALAVVFWLPGQLGGDGSPETLAVDGKPPAAPGAPPAASVTTPPEPAASPWSDAQQARLRQEAQEVLAQLVELQFTLEERGATSWAGPALDNAKAAATRGDAHYQAREFTAATEQYRDSLAQLQALEMRIPDILQAAMTAAADALEKGDADALQPALDTAELLAPADSALETLRQRAAVMSALQAKLDTALALERDGDLAGAEAALRAATQLDPASRRAADALGRVQTAHAEQRYQSAMSNGYTALDEGRFDAAASAFARARSLQPDSPETEAAMAELRATQTADRLGKLQRKAQNLEAQEAWSGAVANYEEALAVDPTLVFAQEGLARAQPRARLDSELREALAAPERLSDPAVARNLEKVLAQARAVAPQGTLLSTQIEQLTQLLARANTPVTVTLRSDQLTAVLVQRVARLGQFGEHSLALRPGTYTAVGTRDGYRDVRKTFTVSPDSPPDPIFIACTDPV